MKSVIAGLGLGLCLAAVAAADPVTAKAAKKALFAPGKSVVEMLDTGLPEAQVKALELGLAAQAYYGAVAMSPEDGLLSDVTVLAANYHSTDAASVAALAECNAKKTGKAECVVAALIRPKGWKDRGFQLSSEATAAFRQEFRAGDVMAMSPATGAWAIGADGDAAVAGCAAKNAGASDCVVAIAE